MLSDRPKKIREKNIPFSWGQTAPSPWENCHFTTLTELLRDSIGHRTKSKPHPSVTRDSDTEGYESDDSKVKVLPPMAQRAKSRIHRSLIQHPITADFLAGTSQGRGGSLNDISVRNPPPTWPGPFLTNPPLC